MTRTSKTSAPIKAGVIPLADLVPDTANPMGHPEENKTKVKNSLKQWGPGRSLVLDRNNGIVSGNCTAEGAPEAGFTEVIWVEPDKHQLVAVRRPDWSAVEARGYSIADNKTAQSAEWESETLAQHFLAIPESLREATGFDTWEIEPLINANWSPKSPANDVDGSTGWVIIRATQEQAEVINAAISHLRELEEDDQITDGHALKLICGRYLSGADQLEMEAEEVESSA